MQIEAPLSQRGTPKTQGCRLWCYATVPRTIVNRHQIRTMCSHSRTLRSTLLLSVFWLALGARGVPVLLGDADQTLSGAAAESGRVAPAAVAPPQEGGATPANASPIVAPRVPRGSPGPATGAETIEAQALEEPPDTTLLRARANSAPPRPLSAAKPAASRPRAGDDDGLEIDPDLKRAAKTALEQAHDAKQWVQPENMGLGDGAFTAGPLGNAPLNPAPGADYSPASDEAEPHDRSSGGDANLILEGIKLVREITGHPVTWLLLPILAFGMLAWRVLQHRARAGRRHARGRDARGVRTSSGTGRRRGNVRSDSTAGGTRGPPSIRRSDRA